MSEKVTLEQQIAMGLRKPMRNEVMALPKDEVIHVRAEPIQMDITPTAQSMVRVDTSHVDRAKGFVISTGTLAFVLGGFSMLIAIFWRDVPFWSLAALVWFGTVYTAVWFIAYVLSNVVMIPEMHGLLDVILKWAFLFRESDRRWGYYTRKGKR